MSVCQSRMETGSRGNGRGARHGGVGTGCPSRGRACGRGRRPLGPVQEQEGTSRRAGGGLCEQTSCWDHCSPLLSDPSVSVVLTCDDAGGAAAALCTPCGRRRRLPVLILPGLRRLGFLQSELPGRAREPLATGPGGCWTHGETSLPCEGAGHRDFLGTHVAASPSHSWGRAVSERHVQGHVEQAVKSRVSGPTEPGEQAQVWRCEHTSAGGCPDATSPPSAVLSLCPSDGPHAGVT